MATTRIINVYSRPPKRWVGVVNAVVFWATLLGAIAVNYHYLGGSWVVQFAAFVLACVWTSLYGVKAAGATASMSVPECIEWVRAGTPEDVKAWRDDRH